VEHEGSKAYGSSMYLHGQGVAVVLVSSQYVNFGGSHVRIQPFKLLLA